ncbi:MULTISPECIES: gluconokinase [unclassified Aureimonas]|uniref:gluconokinase n=1 Tax=unclassified Aureimonas TaxID=2615206 RepID=UPI0006FAE2BA|nr:MULTISPECIES: gluconokinase [unclassified Aureimonas]KQT57366.1 hypothetical protein ASG62_08510 [Aureimonas sp. Leaf427]KQT77044.1 hypothetical protein ASG54_12375 [Aureimonas sp. Leaf460]
MSAKPARIAVVMGVSGSGKSTLCEALRDRCGFRYIDADDIHPPENVEKMRAGIALTDADRAPWLAALAALLQAAGEKGEDTALACSALKARYRDVLSGSGTPVLFVHLEISRADVTRRVAGRPDHYMPASLVDSQFAALEVPEPGPNVLVLDASLPEAELCRMVVERFESGPVGIGAKAS